MKLTIVGATDAFLYLPVYLAWQKGILSNIAEDRGLDDLVVTFEPAAGDADAIRRTGTYGVDEIRIAVCDPIALCEEVPDHEDYRVIGGLLKRPPFWLVNGMDIQELENVHFDKIIGYKHQLATGYALTRHVLEKTATRNTEERLVNFGEELPELLRFKEMDESGKVVAVSADILGIARGVRRQEVKVAYSLSRDFPDFVTTGFVTTAAACRDANDLCQILLEGTRRAVDWLRQSLVITAEMCEAIAQDDRFKRQLLPEGGAAAPLDANESKWIAGRIQREVIFIPDLQISPADWRGAIEHRHFRRINVDRYIELYSTIVDNTCEIAVVKRIFKTDFPDMAREVELTECEVRIAEAEKPSGDLHGPHNIVLRYSLLAMGIAAAMMALTEHIYPPGGIIAGGCFVIAGVLYAYVNPPLRAESWSGAAANLAELIGDSEQFVAGYVKRHPFLGSLLLLLLAGLLYIVSVLNGSDTMSHIAQLVAAGGCIALGVGIRSLLKGQ